MLTNEYSRLRDACLLCVGIAIAHAILSFVLLETLGLLWSLYFGPKEWVSSMHNNGFAVIGGGLVLGLLCSIFFVPLLA